MYWEPKISVWGYVYWKDKEKKTKNMIKILHYSNGICSIFLCRNSNKFRNWKVGLEEKSWERLISTFFHYMTIVKANSTINNCINIDIEVRTSTFNLAIQTSKLFFYEFYMQKDKFLNFWQVKNLRRKELKKL